MIRFFHSAGLARPRRGDVPALVLNDQAELERAVSTGRLGDRALTPEERALVSAVALRLGNRVLGDFDVVAELPAVFRIYPAGSDRLAVVR